MSDVAANTAVELVIKHGFLRTERLFKENEEDIGLETFDSGMIKVTIRSGKVIEMVRFFAPRGYKHISLRRVAAKAVV